MNRIKLAVLRRVSVNLYFFSFMTRGWADHAAGMYHRLSYVTTPVQYINRLIEHYDGEHLWDAAVEYAKLIEAGVDPDHAFKMITGQ